MQEKKVCDILIRNNKYSLVDIPGKEHNLGKMNHCSTTLWIKKEKDIFTRLMNESLYSLSLADWLDGKLITFKKPRFKNNEYDNSFPTKKIEIHVDVNPEFGINKKNKSHIVYSSVMGMLCGSGYAVHAKPSGIAASCAADHILRK